MHLLLESAWRALGLAAVCAIVLTGLRMSSPNARHRGWAALMLLMLALPLLVRWGPRLPMGEAPSRMVAAAASVLPDLVSASAPAAAAGLRAAAMPAAPRWTWREISMRVYVAGVLVLLGRLLHGNWMTRQLARRATQVNGRLTSASCVTPVTAGMFPPRVILPADWPTWPAERLQAILAHEEAHVRRRDTLVQWLSLLNRAVFWFHPLAWWLPRHLGRLAEEACDTAVLTAGIDPVTYADALLHCARHAGDAGGRFTAAAMTMPGSALPQRIRTILANGRHRPVSRRRTLCAVLIGAGAATAVVTARPAMTPERSPLLPALLQAPAPAAAGGRPAFDVVSIKRNPERGTNYPLSPPAGGRLTLRNQTVRGLISSSYGVQDYQIIGGPEWLRIDGFDIEAVVEGTPPPPAPQMLLRIRTLLADRFTLVMHNDQREFPIYRLVTARRDGQLGPAIRPGVCPPRPQAGAPAPDDRPVACGTSVGVGTMVVRGGTMKLLAQQLGRYAGVGRPVFDATNLTDQYEWELKWTPDAPNGTTPADGVSIFTALQEQLGVKLEAARGPIDVLVIDSVAPPSEN